MRVPIRIVVSTLATLALATLAIIYCRVRVQRQCHELGKDEKSLENVIHNKKLHQSSSNIIFHETSESCDGMIKLTSRQACAIESAAKINPGHEIFVLFTSPVGFKDQPPSPILGALLYYPNINFNYLNLEEYAQGTPLEDWIKTGELNASKYVTSHTSDILRYLSLWKFGGTYLDLDTITLKPFTLRNFAGAESSDFINAGIINLEGKDGHEIADFCLRDLLKNFNGNDWGNNGPGVITRVLKQMCKTEKVSVMIKTSKCLPFHVLPVESCYAINYEQHKMFFEPGFANKSLTLLEDSLIAHVWNQLTSKLKLTVDSNSAYIQLAKKFCPKVIGASTDF